MSYDFNFYKSNVSIIQVAERLGYQYNRAKGRFRPEFVHPTEPNIVITNPGRIDGQLYFTRNKDDDKGTVIDFVKNRLHMFNVSYEKEFEGVNKVLASFANVAYEPNFKSTVFQSKRDFSLDRYIINDAQANILTYLINSRELSLETLKAFEKDIKLVQENGKDFQNIGFPYQIPGNDKIVGFELVNYNFKGHARGSDKLNGAWLALEKIRPYNIFLAESAIDAMSFYELFKHKYDLNNSMLVSSGGGLSNSQVENIIKQYPSAKLYGIFDNDISGILYSIRVAAIKEGQPIRINKENELISFVLEKKDKSFKIPIENLSFIEFKNQSGLRPRFTVIKPKNFKDFNQMLKAQKNEAVNLKR